MMENDDHQSHNIEPWLSGEAELLTYPIEDMFRTQLAWNGHSLVFIDGVPGKPDKPPAARNMFQESPPRYQIPALQ